MNYRRSFAVWKKLSTKYNGFTLMKRFFFAFYTIAILSFSHGSLALSDDSMQDNVPLSDCNIVLITIDTLRADHLSCYGYERKTSPTIDKIAEKGIIFNNAIAPSSWTSPSMVSLFTSVYPINHGVVHGFVKENKIVNQEVFSDELVTLAEMLQSRGYTTFGVASNLHLCEGFGFARGFDYFKCLSFHPAPSVNKTLDSWAQEIKQADKYFLWLHYFDPHHYYRARAPWITQYTSKELTQTLELYRKPMKELWSLIPLFQEDPQVFSNFIALYDSEINYVDSHIEEVIQKYGFDKDVLLVITSDHGEAFLDHGMINHGHCLYGETINVPLILKLPHQKTGEVIDQPASLLDIMPTILTVLDIPYSEQIRGEPLLTQDGQVRNLPDRFLFSELEKGNCNMKAILTKEWKYIHNCKGIVEKLYDWVEKNFGDDRIKQFVYKGHVEGLYNRKQDPQEQVNLIYDEISLRLKLKEQLLQWMNTAHRYPATQIEANPSQELQEKLKALGYISDKNSSQ